MKTKIALIVFMMVFATSIAASAEPFDTRHSIYLAFGNHSFFPEDDTQDGTRPDQDGEVTDSEWNYIFDEGYDISDYDGATIELGYEYNFFRWFGLASSFGYYGGKQSFDFVVEGIDAQSSISIYVWHIDVAPRFHWQTRWTDLYGGPVMGLYGVNSNFSIEADYLDYHFKFDEGGRDSGLGWGLNFGFELRIIRNFGIAIEDRVTVAVVNPDDEGAINVGGNVLMLVTKLHL